MTHPVEMTRRELAAALEARGRLTLLCEWTSCPRRELEMPLETEPARDRAGTPKPPGGRP